MKRFRSELQLFFISAILIVCAGFIFISCGAGPQQKNADTDIAPLAIDFAGCGVGSSCYVLVEKEALHNADRTIAGRELTIEAWVKKDASTAAANFTGGIMGRFDTDGIVLYVKNGEPKAAIRRTVGTGQATSTADYIVNSNVNTTLPGGVADLWDNAWHHIAAVLTTDDHTGVHDNCKNSTDVVDCKDSTCQRLINDPLDPGGACTEVECRNDAHLDIYIDGAYKDCNTTWGEPGDPATGPTLLLAEPFAAAVVVGHVSDGDKSVDGVTNKNGLIPFPGAIDEARLWREDKMAPFAAGALLNSNTISCMMTELGNNNGVCGRGNANHNLVTYLRFNEGGSDDVLAEWSGLGGGIKEINGEAWFSGWITGNTAIARAD